MNKKYVEPGDYVKDPMDGELRKVSHIHGSTIYFEDGGCMSMDENFEVYLPSELEY